MIRVLQVVSKMHQGGLENLIMNLYRNIDRDKVQFDFITHRKEKSDFDDEIERLGGKIYRFSLLNDKNVFKYIKELNHFFKTHKEYKIIHGHLASLGFLYLEIAKRNGIPVRISHAHGASYEKNFKGYIKNLLFKFNKYPANYYYACSTNSGKYIFGKDKFEIIPNGIEVDKFHYNETTRAEVRKELLLKDDEIVIGHVGRFELQKNHKFIIDIFEQLYKLNNKYKLVLLGKGKLEQEIKDYIADKDFCNSVKFLGVRKDVYNIYQAMDIFILPSIFEGLPLTGVEAQYAKLECFFSDAISREVEISDNCSFISLEETAENWAKRINEKSQYDRNDNKIKTQKYEAKRVARDLQEKYLNLFEKSKK